MNAPAKKTAENRGGCSNACRDNHLGDYWRENCFGFFLRNAKYEELETTREKVRLDFCNSDPDSDYRINCPKTLEAFDREMRKRARGNEKSHTPSYHSEHGWYLSSDNCPMRVYMFWRTKSFHPKQQNRFGNRLRYRRTVVENNDRPEKSLTG